MAVAGLLVTVGVFLVVRDTPTAAGFGRLEGAVDQPELTFGQVVRNARSVLGERETWVLGTMMFFAVGTNYTVMGLWGVPYLVHTYGLSVETASLFTLGGNAGLLLGSPGVGWLSDPLERRTSITVLTASLYCTLYGGITLVGTPPLVYVGFTFFATMFLHGGFLLSYTIVKERHSGAKSGTAMGTVNGLGFLGAAVPPQRHGRRPRRLLDRAAGRWKSDLHTPRVRIAFGIAAAAGLLALACASWLHWSSRS